MSLAQLQRELAALLLEEQSRRAFARSPKGYAASRLRGKEARLLASLDPDDVAYFGARRHIDRRAQLRADLPRAAALLEQSGGLPRYFRAHPYAREDPREEAARVARWAVRAAREGKAPSLLADLARYESAHLALRATAAAPPKPSARPRRAEGVVLLTVGHDLTKVLEEGADLAAAPRRCRVLLYQSREGVVGGEVEPLAWALLRAADGRRTAAQVATLAARRCRASLAEVQRALEELRREGILSPAPRPRRRG